jgi:RES domain-containing protein
MKVLLHHHPRFVELCDEFRANPEWFTPWAGTLYRFQTVKYPSPKEILGGTGARGRGGRWNPPGLAAVYGSTTDITALEECKANDRYYGLETKTPRLLVAVEVHLARVLDLTQLTIRRALDLTLAELAAEDWRKLLSAGKESFTQSLGRAVFTVGGSGLLVRSAAVSRGVNGVVFPSNCASDRLEVVDGVTLEKLGVKTNA